MNIDQTIKLTVDWYKEYLHHNNMYLFCCDQIKEYILK